MAKNDRLNALIAEKESAITESQEMDKSFGEHAAERGVLVYDADELEKLSAAVERIDQLQRQIELEQRRLSIVEASERSVQANYDFTPPDQSPGNGGGGIFRDGDSLEGFVRWAGTGRLPDGQQSERYHLFFPPITNGKVNEDNYQNRAMENQFRAMSTGDDTAAIPGIMVEPVIPQLYAMDVLRGMPGIRIWNTPDGNDRQYPLLTRPSANNGDVNIRAETTTAADWDADATTRRGVPVHVYRDYIDITREFQEDEQANLLAELPAFIVEALMGSRGRHHMVGTGGNTQPEGLFTYAPTTGTYVQATPTTLTDPIPWESWINFINILPTYYQAMQQIVMHRLTFAGLMATVRLQGTQDANTLVFQPNLAEGSRLGLYGIPITLSEFVPSARAATTKMAVIFTPRYSVIRDVGGIDVIRDPFTALADGETRLHFSSRGGFNNIVPNTLGTIGTLYQA